MEGSSPQSKMDPGLVAYGATSPAGYALGTEENKIFLSFNISGIILWFLANAPVTKLTKIQNYQHGFSQPCKRPILGSLSNHDEDNEDGDDDVKFAQTDCEENVVFNSKIKFEQ